MRTFGCILCVGFVFTLPICASAEQNSLPIEVIQALGHSPNERLFFMLPAGTSATKRSDLCGFPVHSSTSLDMEQVTIAAQVIEEAVANWDGHSTDSFHPRHGLEILTPNGRYVILVSYESERLRVYQNKELLAEVGFTGSFDPLDQLLRTNGLFLSKEEASARHFRQGNDE